MILAALLLALGQDHAMHDMPGMTMPMPKKAPVPRKPAPRPVARKPAVRKPVVRPEPRMDHHHHAGMAADPASAPAPSGAAAAPAVGTALPAGDAAAPPVPMDHWADRTYPRDAMAQARGAMMREQGGRTFRQIVLNIAEYRVGAGYRWDGEAWSGGDLNRVTIKSEGEGGGGGRLETAEVQALYSRAIGAYFDLQAGVRHDFRPSRSYLTVGVEGLAPYWFEVEAAAFLSDRGAVSARVEGYYDQRITQRLVLQPRVEIDLSAQDVPRSRVGRGIVEAEAGVRLRYELAREFAPYLGVSWERRIGRTARLARRGGEDVGGARAVAGLRFWF